MVGLHLILRLLGRPFRLHTTGFSAGEQWHWAEEHLKVHPTEPMVEYIGHKLPLSTVRTSHISENYFHKERHNILILTPHTPRHLSTEESKSQDGEGSGGTYWWGSQDSILEEGHVECEVGPHASPSSPNSCPDQAYRGNLSLSKTKSWHRSHLQSIRELPAAHKSQVGCSC